MQIFNLPINPNFIPLNLPDKSGVFELFKKIENFSPNCFFFESLGPNKNQLSRYSILGFNPDIIIRGESNKLIVGKKVIKTKNPYELLKQLMPKNIVCHEYCGGLVGYLSYEAVKLFEPSLKLKANKEFNLFSFGLYTDGILFDHLTGETKYFYYKTNRLSVLLKKLKKPLANNLPIIQKLRKNLNEIQHKKLVNKILKEIKQGNVFQCEAGLRQEYKISGSLLPVYETLREVNPSPYMYYVKFNQQILLGSSPELLLSVNQGQMETFPLAGTAPRGKNKLEDQKLAKHLLNDPKEQAEHKMLVDLHRNDLGRVAKFGSVKIQKLMDIKKFSHVQHISSQIQGLLRPNQDMFTALQSCFPAGTLTGAPKIEAIKIIASNEKQARGPYGGAVGFFGFNGNCEFAIPIRSLFVSKNKGFIQACGGIVYDSKPNNEYLEIINKLKALSLVLQKFEI